MEKYLKLPTLALIALLLRVLVTGASIGEAIGLIGLAALYAYQLYLNHKLEPIANKNLWDRVIALEEQLQSTREKVNAVQLGNSFKR